ncbi:hypothetical protein [Actinacidiphila glaucinigra]|nr:hypothetical protein [Actinacidiphila glaucinigra]
MKDEPIAADADRSGYSKADNAAYATEPGPGYMPTYLDGSGGIAGIPLTEDQREALIQEAQRRGIPQAEAYALAYGDGAKITVTPDGEVSVDTSGVVVPNGPMYTLLSPAAPPANLADSVEHIFNIQAAPKTPQLPLAPKEPGKKGKHGPHKGHDNPKGKPPKGATPRGGTPYYESSGTNPYDDRGSVVKNVLPPVLGDVIDVLPGFRQWLGDVSGDASNVETTITQAGDRIMITVAATISPDLTVTTVIEAPANPRQASDGLVVTTVVTNPDTGEEIARTDPQEIHDTEQATGVAIGQVVEAVIDAVHQDDANDQPVEFPPAPELALTEVEEAPVEAEEPPAEIEAPVEAEEPAAPAEAPEGELVGS